MSISSSIYMHTRILVYQQPYQASLSLYISQVDRLTNKVYAAQPITLKEVDPGLFNPPALDLDPEDARGLMDSLWMMGIRPSDGTASTGQLKATETHLADMREIGIRLLTHELYYTEGSGLMAKVIYSKEYKGVGDKLYPGVTTVLANLGWNKSILMAWAAKMERQNKDYKAESKEAAEIGTLGHLLAEAYLQGIIPDSETVSAYSQVQQEKAQNAVNALKVWQSTSNLKLFATEAKLISDEYEYGGTADILFTNADGDLIWQTLRLAMEHTLTTYFS